MIKKIIDIQVGKYTLEFSNTVISILDKFKQINWEKTEAGGILLGKCINNKISITKASVPTRFDRRFNYLFIRQKEVAQLIVDYEYYNSNGKIIYLGEWHTHAQDHPSPSSQDIRMLKEQFLCNTLNVPFIILIIKGRISSFIGIMDVEGFWEGSFESK